MRELVARIEAINIRLHNEVAQTARFHGIEIPFKYHKGTQEIEFTPEQDKQLSAALEAAKKRKQQEMRARNG